MDNIVAFRTGAGRARFDVLPVGGASILFFTGIRYEREATPDRSTADAGRANEAPGEPAALALAGDLAAH